MSEIDKAILKLVATVLVVLATLALIGLGINQAMEQKRTADRATELLRGNP